MGTTAPDNIPFPDAGNAVPPLETHFAALAQGAQDGINSVRASATPSVPSEAARNTLYPSPVQSNSVWRSDRGYEERYFSEYNASANPGGATPAGWYPVTGNMPMGAIYRSSTAASLATGQWVAVYQSQYWAGGYRTPDFTAYNNGWTIPITGLWSIEMAVSMSTSSSTLITISLNGTTITVANQLATGSSGGVSGSSVPTINTILPLTANDILRIHVLHTNAAAINWPTTSGGARAEVNGRQILRFVGPSQ